MTDNRLDIITGLELLIAVMEQESGLVDDARSPGGAFGLMQLMPATAKELGVDPKKPGENVKGGALYLIKMLRAFNSVALALAAYNAGPGRVMRAMRDANSTDWEEVRTRLPEETQGYVPAVFQRMETLSSHGH